MNKPVSVFCYKLTTYLILYMMHSKTFLNFSENSYEKSIFMIIIQIDFDVSSIDQLA